MPCLDRKHLKKFYEEEAKRLSHQESMYLKGNKHNLWWHRKRLNYILSFLIGILKQPQITTFADIGCAEGYYIKRVISIRNNLFCVGADIAHTYIKRAKTIVKNSNADFAVCIAENLPFKGNCFDIVLCTEVLEHVPDYHKALNELCRITRKHLVISFPGHSHTYEVFSKVGFLKRMFINRLPNVGHVSEVTISDIELLMKACGMSVQIEIGGALPLQFYKIIPSIRLVDIIDDLLCKILKALGALEHVTIHVVRILKKVDRII